MMVFLKSRYFHTILDVSGISCLPFFFAGMQVTGAKRLASPTYCILYQEFRLKAVRLPENSLASNLADLKSRIILS
jgi:hypothetical protein